MKFYPPTERALHLELVRNLVRAGFFIGEKPMPRLKIVEYKDYADYLNSPKWAQVKKDYAKNEEISNCVCCNIPFKDDGPIPNYHHFRYPKDWNDDSWENLIIVCEDCHSLAHSGLDHHSNPITLRSYISKLCKVYTDYVSEERIDIERFRIAEIFLELNSEVISNREGTPYKVICHDPITITSVNLAERLLIRQKLKTKGL